MTEQVTKETLSKPRISDTELRMLISALEANGKARSISQNDTLLALYELSNRRAADQLVRRDFLGKQITENAL
jgi:hypothetical protein